MSISCKRKEECLHISFSQWRQISFLKHRQENVKSARYYILISEHLNMVDQEGMNDSQIKSKRILTLYTSEKKPEPIFSR